MKTAREVQVFPGGGMTIKENFKSEQIGASCQNLIHDENDQWSFMDTVWRE